MTAVRLEGLAHSVQVTHQWIKQLDDALGWADNVCTYRLFHAVLHTLRDWLSVNEAADFGAQLPTLVRGTTTSNGGWRQ